MQPDAVYQGVVESLHTLPHTLYYQIKGKCECMGNQLMAGIKHIQSSKARQSEVIIKSLSMFWPILQQIKWKELEPPQRLHVDEVGVAQEVTWL